MTSITSVNNDIANVGSVDNNGFSVESTWKNSKSAILNKNAALICI